MSEKNGTKRQFPLGLAKRGYSGVIQHLAAGDAGSALSDVELESRLIELGFVEGARVRAGALTAIGAARGCASRCPYAVACASARIARSGDRSTWMPFWRNAAVNSGGTGNSSPSAAITVGLPAAIMVGSSASTLSIASLGEPGTIGTQKLPTPGSASSARAELVQIDQFGLAVDAVGVDIEEVAGDVVAIAMCKVSTRIIVEREQALVVRCFAYFSPICT